MFIPQCCRIANNCHNYIPSMLCGVIILSFEAREWMIVIVCDQHNLIPKWSPKSKSCHFSMQYCWYVHPERLDLNNMTHNSILLYTDGHELRAATYWNASIWAFILCICSHRSPIFYISHIFNWLSFLNVNTLWYISKEKSIDVLTGCKKLLLWEERRGRFCCSLCFPKRRMDLLCWWRHVWETLLVTFYTFLFSAFVIFNSSVIDLVFFPFLN